MKKKTIHSLRILLVIACLSPFSTSFPLRKEVPPVAGGVGGLAAGYVAYRLLLNKNSDAPRYSLLSHGVRMLGVVGCAYYAGKYVYTKCLEKTPILRFQKARNLVYDAEKAILRSNTGSEMVLGKVFDVDLRQAFEMIQTIVVEIKGDVSYETMYHECRRLQHDIMKMYYTHAYKEFEQIKVAQGVFTYISDAMTRLEDKEFLQHVWRTSDVSEIYTFKHEMEYTSISLERIMRNIDYVIAGTSLLDDSSYEILTQHAVLMKGVIDVYHKRLQLRLDMITDYVRYLGIEEAVQEQITEDRLAPLLSAQVMHLSDGERISLIHSKYTGIDWYKKALYDLKDSKESLVQADLDVQELLRSDSFFPFFDNAEALHKKITHYLEYITSHYYVMDKYTLCALAQDALHTFRKEHRLAELVPLQVNDLTDALVWDWAQRSYGDGWYEPLMRDVRASYDAFVDLKRNLTRALVLPYGASLNAQCLSLQKQVYTHLEALDVITGLLSYYEYHNALERSLEDFFQKTLFKKVIDLSDEQLTEETAMSIIKELFNYAQMPIHVAERALCEELETALTLQRAASNSYKICKEDSRITDHAVEAFKLINKIDRLVKRLYDAKELCKTSGAFLLEGDVPQDLLISSTTSAGEHESAQ